MGRQEFIYRHNHLGNRKLDLIFEYTNKRKVENNLDYDYDKEMVIGIHGLGLHTLGILLFYSQDFAI
jgi:hypothetical protein